MGEPTPPDSGKVIGGNVRVNKELFEHEALHIIQLKKDRKESEGDESEAVRKREGLILH